MNTSNNNAVVHVREGKTNITLTPYNDVGLGESLTTTVCIPKRKLLTKNYSYYSGFSVVAVGVKSMDVLPSMCEDGGEYIGLSLLLVSDKNTNKY